MHKFILVFAMVVMTAPAFAQRYANCQVVMVDNYNRILMRFYAQRDYRTGMCRDGLRQCNYEMRRRNIWGARCVQYRK